MIYRLFEATLLEDAQQKLQHQEHLTWRSLILLITNEICIILITNKIILIRIIEIQNKNEINDD